MIWYIIVFFLLFIADDYRHKNKEVYLFLVTYIAIFFCFGYTCGSDWMDYEDAYNHKEWIGNDLEIGLNTIFRFFQLLNTDFWIVNALCKLFFFFITVKFFSLFTLKPLAVMGFSITTMCFMLISCPMRFMLAIAFFFIAVTFFMRRKWMLSAAFIIIAASFHLSIAVVTIFASTALFFSKPIAKTKPLWLLLAYLGIYVVLITTNFNDILFHNVLVFLLDSDDLGGYALSYGERFSVSSFMSIGRIREIVSFLVIVFMRDYLLRTRYGHIVFYYSLLCLFVSPIIMGMATVFRLNIFFYYFVDIALVTILYESIIKNHQYVRILKYSFIVIALLSLTRTIATDYSFIPYTNSIPYILTEHLPQSERLNYNKKAYSEKYGHTYDQNN